MVSMVLSRINLDVNWGVNSSFQVTGFGKHYLPSIRVAVFMVEDFVQDDWDITDSNSKKVLAALSEFEKGVVVTVDMLHKKTSLMPRGLNDAVRHLSKSKLIENPYPEKKFGPYDFYAVEITDLGREVIEKFG